jgi:hypothetical protein
VFESDSEDSYDNLDTNEINCNFQDALDYPYTQFISPEKKEQRPPRPELKIVMEESVDTKSPVDTPCLEDIKYLPLEQKTIKVMINNVKK